MSRGHVQSERGSIGMEGGGEWGTARSALARTGAGRSAAARLEAVGEITADRCNGFTCEWSCHGWCGGNARQAWRVADEGEVLGLGLGLRPVAVRAPHRSVCGPTKARGVRVRVGLG